ncbi:hypothetical protein KR51_00030900 [Rubidibacter lacunae KORDI 51-2]|uniref:Segregation and condensation protein A n=1 Tax=Rubidibacter lacunae KORDI 51-2 TaxID=582515 RepID=U5DH06_9CHRO|nr:segregation/condensation protein A [Rubidibacter lacunae]ERN40542.1 hypothetical protein KR51_00030900 [Rubidibacter lacunae KORDI 51-2]
MSFSAARAALHNALEQVERGEIDPWDVRVIDAIDRVLDELERRSGDRADLPLSGQAFLWASMLVYFKADALQRLAEATEDDASECEEELLVIADERGLPLHLERHLRRRPAVPPPRRRRATLPELLAQIRDLSAEWDALGDRPRPERPRQMSRREATAAIAQLAHDENLTELAARLEALLSDRLSDGSDCELEDSWLDLEQLLCWWMESASAVQGERHQSPTGDRVGVFWALLLLSSQSKVELSQNEFYQDLSVRWLEPETLPASTVATARS